MKIASLIVAVFILVAASSVGTFGQTMLCYPETNYHPCDCDCLVPLPGGGGSIMLAVSELTDTPPELDTWGCLTSIGVGVLDDPPSWWTFDIDNAMDYWNNSCVTLSSGTNIMIEYVTTAKRRTEKGLSAFIAGNTEWTTPGVEVTIYLNLFDFKVDDWAPPNGAGVDKTDAFMVVAHELGHALGLNHITTSLYMPCTIMTWMSEGTFWPSETVGPADLKAVECLYGCGGGNKALAGTRWAPEATTACDYDAVADVVGFNVNGEGLASWIVTAERETSEYQIRGCHNRSDPGEVLAVDYGGTGEHSIWMPAGDYELYRLFEIDTSGREQQVALYETKRTPLEGHNHRENRIRELRASNTEPPVERSDAICPTYVIFSGNDYVNDVVSQVAVFWANRGHTVKVINVNTYPPFDRDEEIKDDIADFALACGTKYFHLVGPAGGQFNNALWETDSYWNDMKETLDRLGLLNEDSIPDRNRIPTFVRPDLRRVAGGALRLQPFVESDLDYADIDGDGDPDVVVTRWPVQSTADVVAIAAKMQSHADSPRWWTRSAVSSAGDLDSSVGGEGSGDVVGNRASSIETWIAQLETDVNVVDFRTSWFSGATWTEDRDDSLTAVLNESRPEVLTMLATLSNQNFPCGVFGQDWNTSMLDSLVTITVVCAASCYGGYSIPTSSRSVEFLFSTDRGAIAWTGPYANSWNDANFVFSSLFMEKLYGDPARPIGESWLEAIQQARDIFTNYPDHLATIDSYVFLGDPVSPFRVMPDAVVGSYSRNAGSSDLHEMPAAVAVGCPGGDADDIVIAVSVDTTGLGATIAPGMLRLGSPVGEVVFYESPPADSAAAMNAGRLETTITVSEYGGCGLDSVAVYLHDVCLGFVPLNVKSPDQDTSPASFEYVEILDFVEFASHYPSSICDCEHEYTYSACSDFAAPVTVVDLTDFSTFGTHYYHSGSTAQSLPFDGNPPYSAGTVRLDLVEDAPLTGTHTLHAHVTLENVEPYRAAVVSFRNENPMFRYAGWSPNPEFEGQTACAGLIRNSQNEIMLGVVGTGQPADWNVELGYFQLDVLGDGPVQLTDEDFSMVTADLLDIGGGLKAIRYGPHYERSFKSAVYRNNLAQNYPNPFNPQTTIAFSMNRRTRAELRIYDVRGALVKTMVNDALDAGVHRVRWDGRDDNGTEVASGVYFYRLTLPNFVRTKKMVLLR